jgi:hypothetical protein
LPSILDGVFCLVKSLWLVSVFWIPKTITGVEFGAKIPNKKNRHHNGKSGQGVSKSKLTE